MQGNSKPILRAAEKTIEKTLEKRHSFFLLGPRQTGKTTLIKGLLAGRKDVLNISLQDPSVRLTFERDPGLLIRRVGAAKARPVVFVDEVQKVPALLDAVQLLVDEGKASFVLTGSSARKIRRAGANLLPGRVKSFFLDPLTWAELGWTRDNRIGELTVSPAGPARTYRFEDGLAFGCLPGLVSLDDPEDRADILRSYASLYVEEEIRAEALSRKIGAFSRFLELAARESGTSPNLTKLSMETGVSVPAVKEYFHLLEETLIAIRVDPYLKNARKRILSTPRYYLFDTGVRNALARLPLDAGMSSIQRGPLFEHAVVLEIVRRIRLLRKDWRVCFWRTSGGAEVDCVIDMGDEVIPIEIKATTRPRLAELRGLVNFLEEYKSVAGKGYVITQGEEPERLSDSIWALPWKDM